MRTLRYITTAIIVTAAATFGGIGSANAAAGNGTPTIEAYDAIVGVDVDVVPFAAESTGVKVRVTLLCEKVIKPRSESAAFDAGKAAGATSVSVWHMPRKQPSRQIINVNISKGEDWESRAFIIIGKIIPKMQCGKNKAFG
jgi:hypothetical protein